jgi:hypothetical protein
MNIVEHHEAASGSIPVQCLENRIPLEFDSVGRSELDSIRIGIILDKLSVDAIPVSLPGFETGYRNRMRCPGDASSRNDIVEARARTSLKGCAIIRSHLHP